MIKDVIIDIKGEQGIDDQKDVIEFSTDGRFGINNGEYFISYDEGMLLDSVESVKTKLFIKSDGTVILNRSGTINSKMLIEKGKRNSCFYATPVGELVIGIFGDELDLDLNETGGIINLKYTIDSQLKVISRNSVNIYIREVKNDVSTRN